MATTPEKFKYNVSELVGLVEETLDYASTKGVTIPLYGFVLGAGKVKVDESDATLLIEGFIKKSIPFWPAIKERKEEAMAANLASLLPSLPGAMASMVQDTLSMKTGGTLDVDSGTMDCIWEYLESLVKLSVRYIHEKRKPYVKEDGTRAYAVEYASGEDGIPKVRVSEQVAIWKITL